MRPGRGRAISVRRIETLAASAERKSPWIRLVLLLLFLLNALYAAVRNSGVIDELAAHVPCGYVYWMTGVFAGGIDNPPLGQLLIALPVRLLGWSYDLYTEQHLLLFRLPVILMGIALGEVVYRFATAVYDRRAGLAALFLFAFSPNILAHSSIGTLDLPITFFLFLSMYLLYRYVEKPCLRRLLPLCLGVSAAILIKVQGLLLCALVPLVFVAFLREMLPPKRRVLFFVSWLLLPLTFLLAANLVYRNFPPISGELLPSGFMDAVRNKLFHLREGGQYYYLLGKHSREGWWYYFPLAMLLKTPVPTLILSVLGLFRRHGRKVIVFVLLPAAALLLPAMTGRINTGLRHVLPVYPFLFVLAAVPLSRLWEKRWQQGLTAGLVCWYLASAVFIFPHQMSYFNVLIGGPKAGHRYLIGSNLDWGQNEKYLRRYVEDSGGDYSIVPLPFVPRNGRMLVNANALHRVYPVKGPAYTWLRDFTPERQLWYTWFEYHVPPGTFSVAPDGEPARREMLGYLDSVQERFADVADRDYRLALTRRFVAFRGYDRAFAVLRSLIMSQPDCADCFSVAGNLMVRRKQGRTPFRGTEFLYGNPLASELRRNRDEREIVALANRMGVAPYLSDIYTLAGRALLDGGDRARAAEALRMALAHNPRNRLAAQHYREVGPAVDGVREGGERR